METQQDELREKEALQSLAYSRAQPEDPAACVKAAKAMLIASWVLIGLGGGFLLLFWALDLAQSPAARWVSAAVVAVHLLPGLLYALLAAQVSERRRWAAVVGLTMSWCLIVVISLFMLASLVSIFRGARAGGSGVMFDVFWLLGLSGIVRRCNAAARLIAQG